MEITLSIDIGGTNIKAALLPSNISDITEESLRDTTVIYKKTQGWMNKSLPKIVDRDYYASILYHFRDANITQIRINGPFKCKSPVEIDRTDYYVKDFEVPTKFVEKASHLAGLPVTIQNDAQAWINGITAYWLRIKKMELDYPIFAIILGTGIALATAISPEKTKIIELSKTKYHKNVHQAAGRLIWDSSVVHGILGYQFFVWARENKKHWTYDVLRKEYTKRFIALLNDLRHEDDALFKNAKTLFAGGGSVEFLSMEEIVKSTAKKVIFLDSRTLDIDVNLLPLLGNLKQL
jgi:hypothetical protein